MTDTVTRQERTVASQSERVSDNRHQKNRIQSFNSDATLKFQNVHILYSNTFQFCIGLHPIQFHLEIDVRLNIGGFRKACQTGRRKTSQEVAVVNLFIRTLDSPFRTQNSSRHVLKKHWKNSSALNFETFSNSTAS